LTFGCAASGAGTVTYFSNHCFPQGPQRRYNQAVFGKLQLINCARKRYTGCTQRSIAVETWQMETRIGTLNIQLSSAVVLAIGCLILLPTSASGQNVGDPAKARIQEMDRRELQLSGLGKENQNANDPKRAQAIKDQVNDDFHRILRLHNDMVRAIASNSPLDYQFISDATGEINKRAIRLQSTLALHKLEPPEQNPRHIHDLADMQTKDGLIKLCREIELFVKNPIIDTPGTVDAQQLENARRDLESVVELSGAIKKGAERQKNLR
jgi:hypothetical protein